MVSAHSFIIFDRNTRNETYLSSGRQPGRWSLSSMHLQRPLWQSLLWSPCLQLTSEVANRPPQVINEDSTAVTTGSVGGVDEDDEVIEVDNPAGILSSD